MISQRTASEWLKQFSGNEVYARLLQRFTALHGNHTPCFLVSVPDGDSALLFCASARPDCKVCFAHVDEKLPIAEFGLAEGLPRRRVVNWESFVTEHYSKQWSDPLRSALQFYLNSHTGPTGQVELSIPGVNVVANSAASDTALTVGGLIAISSAAGEWGKIAPDDFHDLCSAAEEPFNGRKEDLRKAIGGAEIVS